MNNIIIQFVQLHSDFSIRARNARRVISGSPGVYGHATPDESLVDHQEAMCMANVYKFAARCVAFPISQQLFNKALEPR